MKKKLFSFIVLASIILFHADVFAINAFSQPSQSNSLVNQLFHQALNSFNKFFSHSEVKTAPASQAEMQAAITKYYVSSNADAKVSNQNSAFFDKNTTSQQYVSSDSKPSPDSERAFC